MKYYLLLICLISFVAVSAQNEGKIPSVKIKDLQGNLINTSELSNNDKPFIINFWATWCAPCKRELNAISEEFEDWVEETGVKIFAVSIDDSRTSKRVKPFVDGIGWEFEILLDENSDFRRAMNVQAPPYTFLYDGKGNLAYKHNGYIDGDEVELFDQVKALK